jgi:glycosyltransferase involved in cell wall biosynthesis
MICLLHGYGLTGSGSNLWTRAVARALCQNGHTIHLMCQETDPEGLDFVTAAYAYDAGGRPELRFERPVDYPGGCIMHRPALDLLPVYVRPPRDSTYLRAIPDLDDQAIEEYLARNVRVLRHIVETHGVSALHANHVVLMSVVAQRVGRELGVPYAVMPHGSAIEYVVKQDERMRELASSALSDCKRIFVLSDELRERIHEVFPALEGAGERMRSMRVGVDTDQFELVERSERPRSVERLKGSVAEEARGKSAAQTRNLYAGLSDGMSKEELLELIEATSSYTAKAPDVDIEEKLDTIDWVGGDIIGFVGKLIGFKGIQSVIAAFPAILERAPDARLVVTGRGPLREAMEALVWALANGHSKLARNIASWGGELEGEPSQPFEAVHRFFEKREDEGTLDGYFKAAERHLTTDHVVFAGYLDHQALRHLYPCQDVAIFPSMVSEAGPMVLVEALASGSYPMGSNHSGIKYNLDIATEMLPADDAGPMRLGPEPGAVVEDIIANTPRALALRGKYRAELRQAAVEKYSWVRIAEDLARELQEMDGAGA